MSISRNSPPVRYHDPLAGSAGTVQEEAILRITRFHAPLLLSALLADHDGVELVLGARKGTGASPIDGHAWVRVGEREFSLLGRTEAADEGYLTMTALPVRSGPPPRSGAG